MIRFLFRYVRPITEAVPFGVIANYLVLDRILKYVEYEDGWVLFRDHIMGKFPHCDFGMFSPSKRRLYISSHAGINGITALSNLLSGGKISDMWEEKKVSTLSSAIRVFDSSVSSEYKTVTKAFIVPYRDYISHRKEFYSAISMEYGRATTIRSVLDDDTLLFSTSVKGGKPVRGYLNMELTKIVYLAMKAGDGMGIDEKYESVVKHLVPYLRLMSDMKVGVLISDLSVATDYIIEKSGVSDIGNWVFFPSFPPFSTKPSVGISRIKRKGMDVTVICVRYARKADRKMHSIISRFFPVIEAI